MKNIEEIKSLLFNSDSDAVIKATDEYLASPADDEVMAEVYYLRGNAFRQKGDWKMAMNAYLSAIDLNPDSPAVESYRAAQQVLSFYHTDYYNPYSERSVLVRYVNLLKFLNPSSLRKAMLFSWSSAVLKPGISGTRIVILLAKFCLAKNFRFSITCWIDLPV